MSKIEFLEQLRKGLSGLPQEDIEERLIFYAEMIDDRIEEGLSEEDAVSQIGSVDEIVTQIVADIPLSRLAKARIKQGKGLTGWSITLLLLGSPLWIPLLVAAFAVILSLYLVLWAVIISLWAVFGSLIGCAFGAIVGGIGFTVGGHALTGIAVIGSGAVCAGLSIFMFYGCRAATKGTLIITKKILLGIKNCFIKKEDA